MWANTMDLKLMADDVALAYRRANFKVRTYAFYYTFPPIVVATLNARAFTQLQTDQDSVFCCLALNHRKQHGINAGDPFRVLAASAGCGLKITDGTTRYSFGNVDLVPSEAIAGSGEAPSILPFPYVLAPGTRLIAEIVHLAAHNPGGLTFSNPDTTPIQVDLTMVGIKLVTDPFTRQVLHPEP